MGVFGENASVEVLKLNVLMALPMFLVHFMSRVCAVSGAQVVALWKL